MTTFNFSTGNPANLVGGGGANMTDIGGSFTDLKSFINGGSMDETNLPNLSAAFTTYKTIHTVFGNLTSGTGAAPYMMGSNGGAVASGGATAVGVQAFYFDPSYYLANSRTTKLRVRGFVATNATAPGTTVSFNLYPITSVAGGAIQIQFTLGTVISGSSVVSGALSASTITPLVGTDFNAPAAGTYALAVVLSGAQAGNSYLSFNMACDLRQV